jgi:hypothetical protein
MWTVLAGFFCDFSFDPKKSGKIRHVDARRHGHQSLMIGITASESLQSEGVTPPVIIAEGVKRAVRFLMVSGNVGRAEGDSATINGKPVDIYSVVDFPILSGAVNFDRFFDDIDKAIQTSPETSPYASPPLSVSSPDRQVSGESPPERAELP